MIIRKIFPGFRQFYGIQPSRYIAICNKPFSQLHDGLFRLIRLSNFPEKRLEKLLKKDIHPITSART